MNPKTTVSRHPLPLHSYLERWQPLRDSVRRTIVRIHTAVEGLTQRLTGVSPDRWFLLGFAILFLVFFAILLVQPSSVGRGGR
jgi:hypothetical protein